MMNPLLFADWNRIQRMFRRTMWLVAMVLACVIWAAAAFRAQRAPALIRRRTQRSPI